MEDVVTVGAKGANVLDGVAGDEGEHLFLIPKYLLGILVVARVVDLWIHVAPMKYENDRGRRRRRAHDVVVLRGEGFREELGDVVLGRGFLAGDE